MKVNHSSIVVVVLLLLRRRRSSRSSVMNRLPMLLAMPLSKVLTMPLSQVELLTARENTDNGAYFSPVAVEFLRGRRPNDGQGKLLTIRLPTVIRYLGP